MPVSFSKAVPAASIELADGRKILLEELVQSQTYRSLILGVPNPEADGRIIESALEEARATFGKAAKPYLIQPVKAAFAVHRQKHKLGKEGLKEGGAVEQHRGERLPLVTCLASFSCRQTLEPPEGLGLFDYSIATIVWFQDAFAMPIAPAVLAEIRRLDWAQIAADVSD
jgi:hypothetical protein